MYLCICSSMYDRQSNILFWLLLLLMEPLLSGPDQCVCLCHCGFLWLTFFADDRWEEEMREMKKGLCGWLCCDDCVSARSHSEVASQLFVVLSGFLRYQCIQQQSASSHNVCLFVRSFVRVVSQTSLAYEYCLFVPCLLCVSTEKYKIQHNREIQF